MPKDSGPVIKLREKHVVQQVKDFLEWQGWRARRNQVMTAQNQTGRWIRAGEKGEPDWLFIYYFNGPQPGVALLLWIEFKAKGERLRPDQVDWHTKELKRGALVVTADQFESFRDWYLEAFAWLQKEEDGPQGQQKNLFDAR